MIDTDALPVDLVINDNSDYYVCPDCGAVVDLRDPDYECYCAEFDYDDYLDNED